MSSLMKYMISMAIWLMFMFVQVYAQGDLKLILKSRADSSVVSGVNMLLDNKVIGTSGKNGVLEVSVRYMGNAITLRHLAYADVQLELLPDMSKTIFLSTKDGQIEEVVVSTGYFQAPKERLSGSYTHIDNKLLNRSASPNLLDRLEGIANGLQFDRGALSKEDVEGSPLLRVRGASTILSDARPLIIVDNFPYDGDIRSINPNAVESVTILKDAAAASIWGARAGNGVIVINMKKGDWQQEPSLSFQSNFRLSPRPDLYYDQNVVNPSTMMDIQEAIFDKKGYPERYNIQIPLYVELLISRRDKKITEAEFLEKQALYRNSDIRADALQYIYRPSLMQQYNLLLSGGERIYRYNLSANVEEAREKVIAEGSTRYSLNFTNSFKLHNRLELEAFVRYNANRTKSNNINLSTISNTNLYLPLRDAAGNNLPVMLTSPAIRYANQAEAESLGLLNWEYRPIDDLYENRLRAQQQQVTVGANLQYRLPLGLGLNASYYYFGSRHESSDLYTKDSYFARNYINMFTQANGAKIIPEGAIYTLNTPLKSNGHYLRVLANYSHGKEDGFRIDALAGTEASASVSKTGFPFTFFGYDVDTEIGIGQQQLTQMNYPTKPGGAGALLPIPHAAPSRTNNRNWSGYANTGLQWRQRYVLNGSIRWDASNLLGVESNARGVALWSLGTAWNIHQEDFFRLDGLSTLKLRTTYGSAGNINKSQGHLPVISKRTDEELARRYSILTTPGNPNLRWEQVNTFNVGLDWAIKRNLLSGSFEYYNKHAKDLLSAISVDPTTGVADGFLQNYANLRTEGFDISLQSSLYLGALKLQQNVLFNYSRNRVTKVNMKPFRQGMDYLFTPYYTEGKSADLLYAIPFHGLNAEDGSLLIKDRNGELVNDFTTYTNELVLEDLVEAGVKVAPYYASYRMGVEWKGFNLNTLLIGKFGHVMRRNSMDPGLEHGRGNMERLHRDYYKRWLKPGDELTTTVPAAIPAVNLAYSNMYRYSSALTTPLDYIGIRDINLSYAVSEVLARRLKARSIEVYTSINQLGILWQKNTYGIHPEYPNTAYPAMREFYLGLRFQL